MLITSYNLATNIKSVLHGNYCGFKTMNLPNKEFQLLFLLASNPKHIFTRDDIIEKIWGFDYEGDDRTVDVHIKDYVNVYLN